jgi:hypothetical protein
MKTGLLTRKDGGMNYVIRVDAVQADGYVPLTAPSSALGPAQTVRLDRSAWIKLSRKYRPVTANDSGLIGYKELTEAS